MGDSLQPCSVSDGGVAVPFTAHVRPDGLQHGALEISVLITLFLLAGWTAYRCEVGPHGGGVAAVPREQSIPVTVGGPGLACRGHSGRLAHVGKGGVGVGQLFLEQGKISTLQYEVRGGEGGDLDTLEGAESSGAVIAVARVSVPLAPGHEEQGQSAGVRRPDGLLDGDHVRQDLVVDVAWAEAGALGLVLDNDDIPVAVPDGVKTASTDVASQGLTARSNHGGGGRLPWW